MAIVTQIAPDIFRISIYAPQIDLQFNHFLIKDEEPLLFHTGLKAMFPEVRDEVARLMDPSHLRWISFSHFESDECGSLNHWLELAPSAQPACNIANTQLPRIYLNCPGPAAGLRFRPTFTLCPNNANRIEVGEDVAPVIWRSREVSAIPT